MSLLVDKYKPRNKHDFLGNIPFKEIYETCQKNKSFIICIDGYSGSGKSSLVSHILNEFNLTPIIFDNTFVKSNNNYKEKLNNLKFNGIISSCIVFEDYEHIIHDNFYHSTIEKCISSLVLPVIFTINSNFIQKFTNCIKIIHINYFSISPPSKTSTKTFIDKLLSTENFHKSNKDTLTSLDFLPDIRKVIQSLQDNSVQSVDQTFYSNNNLLSHLIFHKNYLDNFHILFS